MQPVDIPQDTKDVVIDWTYRHVIRADGFVFTAITHPALVLDAMLIKYPYDIKCSSPLVYGSKRTLEEQIEYINTHKIEKAMIIANDISFITRCPTLKHIKIAIPNEFGDGFDYSPLYEMPQIKSVACPTQYGRMGEFTTSIDYSRIRGLEDAHIHPVGCENFRNLTALKSLGLRGIKDADLTDIVRSLILDTLIMTQCKAKSLNGIEYSQEMQCLYLYYNRSLQDISALREVKHTLKALRIQNCPKIEDFSVLGELENLELLELSGSNKLPSLDFLKQMKKLKTFVFSMEVIDGDLTPCLGLSYVYSEKNRKHYNLKDKDLPKGQYFRGNESIEEWRRLM